MSIRTTVTLDEDVAARIKERSQTTGTSFKDTLNELVRKGLRADHSKVPVKPFRVRPFSAGLRQDVNYDDIEGLISMLEGEGHR